MKNKKTAQEKGSVKVIKIFLWKGEKHHTGHSFLSL